MELDEYIATIYEQTDGVLSITLSEIKMGDIFRKINPLTTSSHYTPPPKSSLSEVFLKQCQQTRLLTGNQDTQATRLDTLVTYLKALQLLQFGFKLEAGEFLIFSVVAKNTAKTDILISLFREEFIPAIKQLMDSLPP